MDLFGEIATKENIVEAIKKYGHVTIYYFRQKLSKKNVTTDVKKNFKASAELLEEVTKAYICDAFMEWAGLDDMDGKPSKITIPHANTS